MLINEMECHTEDLHSEDVHSHISQRSKLVKIVCVLVTPKLIIQKTQQCCPFCNRFLVIVTSEMIFTFHMCVVFFCVKLLWFVYIFRLDSCRLTFWCYLPYTIYIVHNNYEPTSQNTDKHKTSCTQQEAPQCDKNQVFNNSTQC